MPTLTLTLPRPHAAQRSVIKSAARFNVVDCGRRFGKTTLGLNRCADPEVLTYPVGWFSPTYKMLLEVWREAGRACPHRPDVLSKTLTGLIAMMDSHEQASQRIDNLEMRLAYQDEVIETLNRTTPERWGKLDQALARINPLEDRLREIPVGAVRDAADETPPPHY